MEEVRKKGTSRVLKVVGYRIYNRENGITTEEKKTVKQYNADKKEKPLSEGVDYRNFSSLFDGIEAIQSQTKKLNQIKTYFSLCANSEKDEIKDMYDEIMTSILRAKNIDDICSKENPNSFYSIFSYYLANPFEQFNVKLDTKDNSPECMTTVVRLFLNSFVVYKAKSIKDKNEITEGNKTIGEILGINDIPNSRLEEDEKLKNYLKSKLFSLLFKTSKNHLCPDCKGLRGDGCPKARYMMDKHVKLEDGVFDFITDAYQEVKILEDENKTRYRHVEKCFVTGCSRYEDYNKNDFYSPAIQNLPKYGPDGKRLVRTLTPDNKDKK